MTERSVSRPAIVATLTEVFRERGYEGASLARLSAATGLKKASLYHHFPGGKEEMAEAVLDALAAWFNDNMFAPLRGDEPLEARVQAMRAALDAHYGGGEKGCLFGLLAMGGSRDRFASRTAAFFGAWIAALSAALREAGFDDEDAVRRAADVVMEVEGALMLSRGLADTGPFQRVLRRLPAVLLGDARPAEAAVEAPDQVAPEPPEEAPEPPEPAAPPEPAVEFVEEPVNEPEDQPEDQPEAGPEAGPEAEAKDPLDPAAIEALLDVSATDEPAGEAGEASIAAGADAPPDAGIDGGADPLDPAAIEALLNVSATDEPGEEAGEDPVAAEAARAPDPMDEIVSGPPAGDEGDAGDDWIDEIPDAQDLAAMLGDQTIGPIDSNEVEGPDSLVAESDDPPAGSDDEDTS